MVLGNSIPPDALLAILAGLAGTVAGAVARNALVDQGIAVGEYEAALPTTDFGFRRDRLSRWKLGGSRARTASSRSISGLDRRAGGFAVVDTDGATGHRLSSYARAMIRSEIAGLFMNACAAAGLLLLAAAVAAPCGRSQATPRETCIATPKIALGSTPLGLLWQPLVQQG